MADVFLAVLPVFMMLGVGMMLDRIHLLPASFAGQLNLYIFKVAMPCLLLRLVADSQIASLTVVAFLAALFLSHKIVFAGSYVWLTRGLRRFAPGTAIIALSCACSNNGFLGLPIIDSLLPGNKEALVAAGLTCIMPPLVLVCAQSIIELRTAGEGERRSMAPIIMRAVFLNPFVIATMLGVMISLGETGIWKPVDRVMALIGQTGPPCALIALGLDMWRKMEIARRAVSPHRIMWQSTIVFFKLVAHPLLAWSLLAFFGVTGIWLAVGVLMTGTSTAVMAYVLAEVTHEAPEECALAVVITAFLSMFSIPLLAVLLRNAGYM